MAQQYGSGLPPPVTSGLSSATILPPINFQPSPFATSLPIPLQTLGRPAQNPAGLPVSDDEKKKNPWKHEGYREFSKLMASDDDFFIIRRFQSLNANVILYMQDRIAQIEGCLNIIHEKNANDPGDRGNHSFRRDVHFEPDRARLMCELTNLLHHYNQYIDTFSRIRARPKADSRQIHNLNTFMGRRAIEKEERKFADYKQDLISINPKAASPLGRCLEATRLIRLSSWLQAKVDPDSQIVSEYVHYGSDSALATLTTISIILLGFAMLLGPMWWLNFVSNGTYRLAIITVFLFIFMLLMSLATNNRPFEVVASAAAYAAVLMVFMQIGN